MTAVLTTNYSGPCAPQGLSTPRLGPNSSEAPSPLNCASLATSLTESTRPEASLGKSRARRAALRGKGL